jgi:hypothetical protein
MLNVIAAYEKFHDEGCDILSVSFDRTNPAKLASFTKNHKIPWAQVCEGKFWLTTTGGLSNIASIPHDFSCNSMFTGVRGDVPVMLALGFTLPAILA